MSKKYDPSRRYGMSAPIPSKTMKGVARKKTANEQRRADMLKALGGTISSALYDIGYDETPEQPTTEKKLSQLRPDVSKWLVFPDQQSFADIHGNEAAFRQLRSAIEAPVKQAELYARYNLTTPKGAVLHGPPGNGKTMFARAVAYEMSVLHGGDGEFLSISGNELQGQHVGETEKRIKAIFNYANAYQEHHGRPVLIFIDEAEVILPDRNNCYRFQEANVATFLAEMDGIKSNGAFMLLATNRIASIDPALLRDGRCDFKIEVAPPTIDGITEIVLRNFEGKFCHEPRDELTFAAVESLCNPDYVLDTALAFKGEGKKIIGRTQRDFCLEHILSGAMAASIPTRASRVAFERDARDNTVTGIITQDVLDAVKGLYEENRNIPHPYAAEKFAAQFTDDLEKKDAK